MLFETALARYITIKRAENLAEKTCYTYERDVRQFFQHLKKEDLKDATNDDIDDYLIAIAETHSPKTRQNKAHSLRGFFKYWYAKRETEVAYELINGPRKIAEKQPNVITPEMFDLIDDYLSEDNYYQLTQKVIFNLLWNTGMRIGESLATNITDINLKERHMLIRSLKSKRLRIVVWNEACHKLLIKYLGIRVCLNQAPELFQTPQGIKNGKRTRLTSRTVQRWCKEIGNELGVKMNPHSFRHGRGHYILAHGGTRENIQIALGHVSMESTHHYTRLNPQEQLRLQQAFLPENRRLKKIKSSYYEIHRQGLQ